MQHIWVFQQRGSGMGKIKAISTRGRGLIISRIVSIDDSLPLVVEQPELYIPHEIQADLVLDFLKHPDLSLELALRCKELGIPIVASGKKLASDGVIAPPT